MAGRKRKPKGRPPKYVMPERIPDSPENVARALMRQPPRKPEHWKFVQEFRQAQEAEQATPDTDSE